MRTLFILFTFFTFTVQGQRILTFDHRFVQSEDKWVAFQKDKDGSYAYGFIYIDAQAGLTFNYEGNFTISEGDIFTPKKMDTNTKIRLEPNQVRVAWIPEHKFPELKIQAIPEWLKYYKSDTASAARLYHWGYMYNGWNECAKALTFLEKAQHINPQYEGLSVELAFSYNCLQQYDKAIVVLQNALETNPTDAYTNKELIYAQVKTGNLDKAAESCKKAIAVCTDTTYNGENCYNLLHSYYEKKNRVHFNLWLTEAKKWTADNAKITQSIQIMETELAK
jgi:tetratricopeptide (TPR) repeat protein